MSSGKSSAEFSRALALALLLAGCGHRSTYPKEYLGLSASRVFDVASEEVTARLVRYEPGSVHRVTIDVERVIKGSLTPGRVEFSCVTPSGKGTCLEVRHRGLFLLRKRG